MKRNTLLFLLFVLLTSVKSVKTFAYDIAVENADGKTIYYNYSSDGKGLIVTYGSQFSGSSAYSGSVVIPEEVTYMNRTRKVISIGFRAFFNHYHFTSVSIPNSVTSIDGEAFLGCSDLSTITIPNSVISIDYSAFSGCNGLTSVIIGNSVTSIGDHAFYNCSSLSYVTIPNSVMTISDGAFSSCSSLTSVIIGNSLISIGDGAFSLCYRLCSLTIPNSVKSIGKNAFSNCSGLTSVYIADIAAWCKIEFKSPESNPLYYAKHLFLNNEEVNDLIIPNSVTSIGDYAFSGFSSMTSLTIPNSVISIGDGAFTGCGITSVRIPNSVTSINDETFSSCVNLRSLIIPESVTSIGARAFYDCSSLSSVTIPNSVISIGNYAFSYCSSLRSLTIGKSVMSIGSGAFFKSDIPTVISLIEYPFAIKSSAFTDDTYNNATLYVPFGTINRYKATSGWNKFLFIEEGTGPVDGGEETPETKKCALPTIGYQNGQLTFKSQTIGATCHYTITDDDIKNGTGSDVKMGVTYHIRVYATRSDYEDSDVATGTLCWIDVEPKTEGITNAVAKIRAMPVLIQSNGSMLTISGAEAGSIISIYDADGRLVASSKASAEITSIDTSLPVGEACIVKIGEKTVKVAME